MVRTHRSTSPPSVPMLDSERTWYFEALTRNVYQAIAVKSTLYSGQTQYQKVMLLDTEQFGRVLVLDGKTQSSELDEPIYHDALVHPAMLTHPNPKRVFVAGGGEGATLREVLNHTTVESATMVDIDGEVVDLCRRLMPSYGRGAFEDPRTTLHLTDAYGFLAESTEPFDTMILDLPDPLDGGPAYKLFTKEFYSLVHDKLTEHGTVGLQTGSTWPGTTYAMASVHATLASVFPFVRSYRIEIPVYGGTWAFAVASKGEDPAAMSADELDRRIAQRIKTTPTTYDGMTHNGMMSLPKNTRDAMAREGRIITEAEPLLVT